MRTRRIFPSVLVAGSVVMTATVLAMRPGVTSVNASHAWLVLHVVALASLLVAWTVSGAPDGLGGRGRPSARLLDVAPPVLVALFLLPELAGVAGLHPVVRTFADAAAFLLPAMASATAVTLVAAASAPRQDWRVAAQPGPHVGRWCLLGVCAGGIAALARVWLVDPFLDVRCWRWCESNPVAWDGLDGAGRVVIRLAVAVLVICGAVVVANVTWRARVDLLQVAGAAALVLGTLAGPVLGLVTTGSATGEAVVAAMVFSDGGVVVLGTCVVTNVARRRLAQVLLRRRITALAYALSETASGEPLAAALGRTIGDPSLVVRYPWDGGWVDDQGLPAPIPDGVPAVTSVHRGTTLVAVLVRSDGVAEVLAPALGPAATIILDNQRLAACARAELRLIEASRARLVEASARERHRLERDLHDGAQQSLIALTLAIGLLLPEATDDATTALVDRAATAARNAVEELRRVAHGIFPAVLSDGGIDAALEELAEASTDVPVRLDVPTIADRLPRPVEVTTYRVAEAAVRDAAEAGAPGVSLVLRPAGGTLRLTIDARAGMGRRALDRSRVELLRDEAAALGGTLIVDGTPEAFHVHLELPCGS